MLLRCFIHFDSITSTSSFARSIRKNMMCNCTSSRIVLLCKIKTGKQLKNLHISKVRCVNFSRSAASSLDSMVFSQENKASCIKQMAIMKPSTTRIFFKRNTQRFAGVCVPLCRINKVPSILYTLRSHSVSIHRGEISFPGGIMDKMDADVTQTTLRETTEELGICQESIEIWGQLAPVPDRSGKTLVTATLGYIGDIDLTKVQYNTKEVELVFSLPISHLCDPRNHGYTRFDPSKSTAFSTNEIGPFVLPVFRGAGYHIWGLTAVFTDLALGVLAPDHYKSLYF